MTAGPEEGLRGRVRRTAVYPRPHRPYGYGTPLPLPWGPFSPPSIPSLVHTRRRTRRLAAPAPAPAPVLGRTLHAGAPHLAPRGRQEPGRTSRRTIPYSLLAAVLPTWHTRTTRLDYTLFVVVTTGRPRAAGSPYRRESPDGAVSKPRWKGRNPCALRSQAAAPQSAQRR